MPYSLSRAWIPSATAAAKLCSWIKHIQQQAGAAVADPVMENSSMSSDVYDDVSTSSPSSPSSLQSGDPKNLMFKVIYSFIGIVGVADNLFVLVIFGLFIKITDKVFQKSEYC